MNLSNVFLPLRSARWATLVASVSLCIPPASGAVRSWTGGGGNAFWGTTANWAPAGIPQAGDDLVFPAGAARLVNTNNLGGLTVGSITFNGVGGGYVLRGNAINLSRGISAQNTGGGSSIYIALTLTAADAAFATTTASGSVAIESDVNLNGHSLTLAVNTAALSLGGVISGTGDLTKTNSGTLTLYGNRPNTYNGSLTVEGGLVQLWKVPGPAVPGPLVAKGAGTTVRLAADHQLSDNGLITMDDAALDLGGWTDTVGPVDLCAARVQTSGGLLVLNGNITNRPAAVGESVIEGRLNLGSATRVVDVVWDFGYNRLLIHADIEGALTAPRPGLTLTGGGYLELSGNNTYYGTTTVDGRLIVRSDTALGDTLGGTVMNGLGGLYLEDVQVGSETLTVNGSGYMSADGTTCSWAGDIVLNGDIELSTDNCSTLLLSGSISGAGGLVCQGVYGQGSGEINLSGPAANSYSGVTTVNNGTLVLSKAGVVSVPGALVIGDGMGDDQTDVVQVTQLNQIANTAAVRVNRSGLLQLDGASSDTIGSLTFQGGCVRTDTGTLTLNGNVTSLVSTAHAEIHGQLSLGEGTRIFHLDEDEPAAPEFGINLSVWASISDGGGAAGITQTGWGELALWGSNTYSGVTTLMGVGVTYVGNDMAFGSPAGGTIVRNGSILHFLPDTHVEAEPLVLHRDAYPSFVAMALSGTASWGGPIDLAMDATIKCPEAEDHLTLSGVISGAGYLEKVGNGTLRLSGSSPNTYSSPTYVREGVLALAKTSGNAIRGPLVIGYAGGEPEPIDVVRFMANDQIDASAAGVTVNASGWLDLNGYSDSVGPITLNGGRITTGSGTLWQYDDILVNAHPSEVARIEGRLLLNNNRTLTVAGHHQTPDLEIRALVYGNGSLTKAGDGVLSLTSSNAYAGFTRVDGGALLVDHSWALGGASQGTHVRSNAVLSLRGGVAVAAESLTLDSAGSPAFQSLLGSNTWAGPVTLNRDTTIWIRTNDWLNLAGAVGGPAGFAKIGPGTLLLSGSATNTYAGDTRVHEGALRLGKSDSAPAISGGTLVIGDGAGGELADRVIWEQDDQVAEWVYAGPTYSGWFGRVPVLIHPSGWMDLNGYSDVIAELTMHSGRIDTRSGRLILHGDVSADSTRTNMAMIDGYVSLTPVVWGILPNTRTFDVAGTNSLLGLNAELEGLHTTLVKTGDGQLNLSRPNNYSMDTVVRGGVLSVSHAHALSGTNSGTRVEPGASLALRWVTVQDEPLVLAGDGFDGQGALQTQPWVGTLSNAWSGHITLSNDVRIGVSAGTVLDLSGPITGAGGFTKTGEGPLLLSGGATNTYAGSTRVDSGALVLRNTAANGAIPGSLIIGDGVGGPDADVVRLEHYNQIHNESAVTVDSSGLMEMVTGLGDAIGSLSGGGRVDLGHANLAVGHNDVDTLFSGTITGLNGCELNKEGAGTLTLSGTNTYPGWTYIREGTLVVDGWQPNSPVSVGASGTLSGSGVIGELLAAGAVRPGTSPGILTSGSVTLDGGADLFLELNGPVMGSGYDQLAVHGSNTLSNPFLHVAFGYAPCEGAVYTLLNNDGSDSIQGMFAGLPEGAVVHANGIPLRVSYAGGDGNDVALTVGDLPLDVAGAILTGGNGNGVVEPDECNLLVITLTNAAPVPVTGLSAQLSPATAGVFVSQASAVYPDVPSGGVAAHPLPFQFSTAPTFSCGMAVEMHLTVTTDAHGAFVIPVALPSGSPGTAVRFNHLTPLTVPDGGRVLSPLSVGRFLGRLAKVTVSVHVKHPAAADLDLSLLSPDGAKIELSTDNGKGADYGSSCEDKDRTWFDDDARESITNGRSPMAGSFRPEGALGILRDTAAIGTWTLVIEDDTANGMSGALQCWSLFLHPAECAPGGGPCELCPDGFRVSGVLDSSDPTQAGQLQFTGVASQCGLFKIPPGLQDNLPRRYDAYTFAHGPGTACITVGLSTACATDLFCAAYRGEFDAGKPDQHCAADGGGSGRRTYSFTTGADSTFVVVVSEAVPDAACTNYALSVSGGDCQPVLHVAPAGFSRVVLDWTSSAVGYQLERAAEPAGPAFVPAAGSPVILHGQFSVTNTVASNRFYRLHHP
ncbi:MAG: autotransporter-associated beta strand repeat-containing protein [Verrucomicrobia bacterium]|nr:autotransporter-associated beta strand repeat-containing protein [Verrucomicrobiota bacterium]